MPATSRSSYSQQVSGDSRYTRSARVKLEETIEIPYKEVKELEVLSPECFGASLHA